MSLYNFAQSPCDNYVFMRSVFMICLCKILASARRRPIHYDYGYKLDYTVTSLRTSYISE